LTRSFYFPLSNWFSGKVVLTKAKKRKDVFVAFQKFMPVLDQFKEKSSLDGAH
jgi:hypothetical protein